MHIRSFLIRITAAIYDALILLALWILATALWIFIAVQLGTWETATPLLPWNLPFDLYILGVSYLYLGGLWRRTGQTLGMRAWRIQVVDKNGEFISWTQGFVRMLAAMLSWLALGAGWIWILFDKEGKALHDRLSGTEIVRLPTES